MLGGGKVVSNCSKCGHKVYFKTKLDKLSQENLVEDKQPELRNDEK